MNRYVQNKIEFAQALSKKIDTLEHLHAILIGGSVAKGWADEYSDLELCLCWEKPPSFGDRTKVFERLHNKSNKLPNKRIIDPPLIFEESINIENTHIDLWHCSDDGIRNAMQEVLDNLNTAISMQHTLFTLQNGIILKDSRQLQSWRQHIQYPQELRKKCIVKHLSIIVNVDLRLHVLRKDKVIYYNLLSGIQKRIIDILYGLNGVFNKGQKNTKSILESLEIKPVNCWERFQKVYKVSGIEAVSIMDSLMDEIFDLVNVNLPELDISNLKDRFNNKGRIQVKNFFKDS